MLILKDRTYFFKGIYNSAKNVVLNYINFVSILNSIDIAKIVFAQIKLGILSNA
jgi:hypothetical protein